MMIPIKVRVDQWIEMEIRQSKTDYGFSDSRPASDDNGLMTLAKTRVRFLEEMKTKLNATDESKLVPELKKVQKRMETFLSQEERFSRADGEMPQGSNRTNFIEGLQDLINDMEQAPALSKNFMMVRDGLERELKRQVGKYELHVKGSPTQYNFEQNAADSKETAKARNRARVLNECIKKIDAEKPDDRTILGYLEALERKMTPVSSSMFFKSSSEAAKNIGKIKTDLEKRIATPGPGYSRYEPGG